MIRVYDMRTGLYHDQIRDRKGRIVSRKLAAIVIHCGRIYRGLEIIFAPGFVGRIIEP